MKAYNVFLWIPAGVLLLAWMLEPPNPIARIMGEPVVPLSVKLAAIGLLAIGLLIGFVAGLVTGWMMRDRR
jgi:hypothetical protein